MVERIETFVTFETKTILGVETRVVRDRTYLDSVPIETARTRRHMGFEHRWRNVGQ